MWDQIGKRKLIEIGCAPIWISPQSQQILQSNNTIIEFEGNEQQTQLLMQIVNRELLEGTLRVIQEPEIKLWNPTYLEPKPNGEWRRILDCRTLNRELVAKHFKMTDIRDTIQMLRKGDWMCTLDITSAFNHIRVNQLLQQYLAFRIQGVNYTQVGMPFGINIAPYTFAKTIQPTVERVREKCETQIQNYADDIILFNNDKTQIQEEIMKIITIFEEMGWIINRNKSKLEPNRQITFLGWSWNTETMTLQTTRLMRKQVMAALIKQAQLIQQQQYQTVRSVARLIGQIQYIRVQYTRGGLHITSMNREMSKRAKIAGWDSPLKLSRRALVEVEWWIAQIKNNKPKNIEMHKTQAIITTDASLGRWGATLQIPGQDIQRISKPWKVKIPTSNRRETTTILLALNYFQPILQHSHLRYLKVRTDNTTACYNLTKGKVKVGLRRLVDQILLYIEQQQWEVKFRHIPGINNTEADSLSRLAVSGDYSIDKQMLQQVLEEWGIQITVDCFATRRNTKHHRYFSIESDALADNWDGMEQSWECETPLLHCPISLIPAVIRKVELEKVKGVLIAPIWKGQVWWTALMRITIYQKELGNSQDVLKEGTWMKRNNQKLPPGKIGIFLVDGERRESNYSKNAYQIQDQQGNQYKEQQMDGTEAGRDTHVLQQYLQSIGLNNPEQFYNYQHWSNRILQQPTTQHILNRGNQMHVQFKQGTPFQRYLNSWANQ
ncbi:MAG: putative Transposon Ty3-I Gag-Pol polyprotein [Streblomastix strix]|uniref:Putative Transposon Ty3-I Gag-Pol polyprotein n=1 Tax=Streblomastix strix TaxID=222440 RepID=A0A5J4VTJ1_9EUKA|nr:MAG: putative Transposon Ty3-I Gag-Pol polyprotein [Streblomastix strix]